VEALPVLSARFPTREELAAVVRAALEVDIAYVPLPAKPSGGRHTIQLWFGSGLLAAVVGELVGSGRDGSYPMRVRPIDPAHVPELAALTARVSSKPPVPSPPPEVKPEAEPAPGSVPEPTGPGTVVFNPDAVVRDGPVSSGTASEDVTLPGSDRTAGGGGPAVSWNVRTAPSKTDPLCGRTIASGKYVLDSVIGVGAIGIVFKASHTELGRTVAIKVLHPRYREDAESLSVFRTEARAASVLEHPHVARVYDYGQEPDGLVYIVMEYLSGYTLGSVLAARRVLVHARAVEVMMQICGALAAAHDRGIVHRDVKPDNIVLVPEQDDEGAPVEIVKVCDFGIAALGPKPHRLEESGETFVAGTPEYMAPEQAMAHDVSPATDVYASGVVLYEMITGRLPFTGSEPQSILMKHVREKPQPPSATMQGIHPGVERVVLRALEKDPHARYQSAREMRIELRKAL
jgi:serine/threonine-protein kinase